MMAANRRDNSARKPNETVFAIVVFLLATDCVAANATNVTDDLAGAESSDGQLEIIKQIKKVNDDGSYTIGYEADDGSFKIESRDVLGNIKGTYGYIDETGEIKRVSYASTKNRTSETVTTAEAPSVVQRIPRANRTVSSTTRRPLIVYPNLTTPTSVGSATRRRIVSSTTAATTTTEKPNHYPSTTSPVRILTSTRPIVRSTGAPSIDAGKEGQLDRPDVYKKTTLLETDIKPVTEGDASKSNLLRRQLSTEKPYDARQHLQNLEQGIGQDAVDVYSASVTTGTPRPPLFTTTARSPLVSTPAPIIVRRYENYRPPVRAIVAEQTEATTESEPRYSTPSSVPIVQIPASRESPDGAAVAHPFHRGPFFVPLQQRYYGQKNVPYENSVPYRAHYFVPKPPQQVPVFVRRPPMPSYLRPIPVHVDENGFVREIERPSVESTTVDPARDERDEIDYIRPPVSTRDFQKILEHLILRQTRLEQLSMLARLPTMTSGQYRPTSYVTRGPAIQFVPAYDQKKPAYAQTQAAQTNRPTVVKPQEELYYTSTPQSAFAPTRRVARLLTNRSLEDEDRNDEQEYLPPDVREMLLLKMLQLAMNPALPLDAEGILEAGVVGHESKKEVRNVEILGEVDEDDATTTTIRSKREKS